MGRASEWGGGGQLQDPPLQEQFLLKVQDPARHLQWERLVPVVNQVVCQKLLQWLATGLAAENFQTSFLPPGSVL